MRTPVHLRRKRADDRRRLDVAGDPVLRERDDLEDHLAALLLLRLRVDSIG